MKNIKKFKTIRSATDNSEAIKESVVQAIRSQSSLKIPRYSSGLEHVFKHSMTG